MATNASLYAKINEIKNNLATTTTTAAVENKIPNVSNLVPQKMTVTHELVKLKIRLLLILTLVNLLLQD